MLNNGALVIGIFNAKFLNWFTDVDAKLKF